MFIWCSNSPVRNRLTGLLFFCFSLVQAQSWSLAVQGGHASYSFQELKDFQEYLKSETTNRATTTESFPSYWYYGFQVSKEFKKIMLSVDFGHGSTGGRVYYEDYSGKFVGDQLVTYNYLGLSQGLIKKSSDKWQFTLVMRENIVMYALTIKNNLELGSSTFYEQEEFKTTTIGIQPAVQLRRFFGKIFIQSSLGYEFQMPTEFYTENDLFLSNKNGEPVRAKGNGYRFSIGVGVRF